MIGFDMQANQNDPSAPLRIGSSFDMTNSSEIHAAIAGCLGQRTGVFLDLSEADNCDVAGVQLLYAAKRSAAEAGLSFGVTAVSESFIHVCKRLNIDLRDLVGVTAPGSEATPSVEQLG